MNQAISISTLDVSERLKARLEVENTNLKQEIAELEVAFGETQKLLALAMENNLNSRDELSANSKLLAEELDQMRESLRKVTAERDELFEKAVEFPPTTEAPLSEAHPDVNDVELDGSDEEGEALDAPTTTAEVMVHDMREKITRIEQKLEVARKDAERHYSSREYYRKERDRLKTHLETIKSGAQVTLEACNFLVLDSLTVQTQAKGKHVTTPFGYRQLSRSDEGLHTFRPHLPEYCVVYRIQELRAEGHGIKECKKVIAGEIGNVTSLISSSIIENIWKVRVTDHHVSELMNEIKECDPVFHEELVEAIEREYEQVKWYSRFVKGSVRSAED